jgi:polyhydroxyalkanoate synthesis regulator protein
MADMEQALILIKRYAGERLYNTFDARDVTVDDIRIMANGGMHVVVVDADDGRDVTGELIARTQH